jgi:2-methylcitrate dehydratase PrpD
MEERHTERAPRDVLGGQYSLPFTTAVALTRDMADPLVYDDEAIRDPLVRDLARRIELDPVAHDGPETAHVWPAEILIDETGRHHVLRTRPHKGSTRNPFTWDDACEKFRRYTARVIGAQGRPRSSTPWAGWSVPPTWAASLDSWPAPERGPRELELPHPLRHGRR